MEFLRLQVALQWHGEAVPVAVETCPRADCPLPLRYGVGTVQAVRIPVGADENLHCGAIFDAVCSCSLPCVMRCGSGNLPREAKAKASGELLREIPIAKEAKEPVRL